MATTYRIENQYLCAEISQSGAEVISVWSKMRNEEILWQGKEWQGNAPILFPIVGNLPQGQYRAKGDIYHLPRHGFARNAQFELRAHSSTRLTLGLRDSEQSRLIYPYAFEFSVSYQLDKNTLLASLVVANETEAELPFSVGIHPAFAVRDDTQLVFERSPRHYCYGHRGFVDFAAQPHVEIDERLTLSSVDFSRGAIYVRNIESQHITLRDGDKSLVISVPDLPYLVLWKKAGCDFICVEPCFGITSPSDQVVMSLAEKPGIVRLAPGHSFSTQSGISVM